VNCRIDVLAREAPIRGIATMIYIVKWRKIAGAEPQESRKFDSKAAAEQFAFARIRQDYVDSVWIENEKEQRLVDHKEIVKRHMARGI